MGWREDFARSVAKAVGARIQPQNVHLDLTPEIVKNVPEYIVDENIQVKLENTELREQLKKLGEEVNTLKQGVSSKEAEIINFVEHQKKLKKHVENLTTFRWKPEADLKAQSWEGSPFVHGYTNLYCIEMTQRDDGEYNLNLVIENPEDGKRKKIRTKQSWSSIAERITYQSETGIIQFNVTKDGLEVPMEQSTEDKYRRLKGEIFELQQAYHHKNNQVEELKKQLQEQSKAARINQQRVDVLSGELEKTNTQLEYINATYQSQIEQDKARIAESSEVMARSQNLTLETLLTAKENEKLKEVNRQVLSDLPDAATQDDLEEARIEGRDMAFDAIEQAQKIKNKPRRGSGNTEEEGE